MSSSSTSAMMPIPLLFNCGYAVYEISAVKKVSQEFLSTGKFWLKSFKTFFLSMYQLSEEYWKELQSSKFNQHCDFTLDCICRRILTAKQQYLEFFSIDKWKSLSGDNKRRHTVKTS